MKIVSTSFLQTAFKRPLKALKIRTTFVFGLKRTLPSGGVA